MVYAFKYLFTQVLWFFSSKFLLYVPKIVDVSPRSGLINFLDITFLSVQPDLSGKCFLCICSQSIFVQSINNLILDFQMNWQLKSELANTKGIKKYQEIWRKNSTFCHIDICIICHLPHSDGHSQLIYTDLRKWLYQVSDKDKLPRKFPSKQKN